MNEKKVTLEDILLIENDQDPAQPGVGNEPFGGTEIYGRTKGARMLSEGVKGARIMTEEVNTAGGLK